MTSIQPPSTLLFGPPGSGKTTAIATLLESGLDVFDIITEPSGLDSVLDAINYLPGRYPREPRPNANVLLSKFHWHVIESQSQALSAMRDTVKKIGLMSFKDLKSIRPEKSPDVMLKLLDLVDNFTDQRTGTSFGSAGDWDDSRVLVLDHLTGLNDIIYQLVVGHKPSPDQGEWGVMVGQERDFLRYLLGGCKCFLVVLAHVNKSTDEVSGMAQVTPAAMTYNFSGKIGIPFSEVVLAKRVKDKFTWSTSETLTDVKNRALPISDSLPPSFAPIILAHRDRVKSLTLT